MFLLFLSQVKVYMPYRSQLETYVDTEYKSGLKGQFILQDANLNLVFNTTNDVNNYILSNYPYVFCWSNCIDNHVIIKSKKSNLQLFEKQILQNKISPKVVIFEENNNDLSVIQIQNQSYLCESEENCLEQLMNSFNPFFKPQINQYSQFLVEFVKRTQKYYSNQKSKNYAQLNGWFFFLWTLSMLIISLSIVISLKCRNIEKVK